MEPPALAEEERSKPAPGEARWGLSQLLVAGVCAVAVIGLRWLPQLSSSLWLDETGTVWLLQGSFTDSLARALEYQGGSPLFYVVEWLVTAPFGTTELALRMPSLIAMAGAAGLVFLTGRHLFGVGAGAISAVVFTTLPLVGFAAGDARPYALATMTLVASALALVRWVDSGRRTHAVWYACAFVATVYLHYLLALPLFAHGIYLLARRERSAISPRAAATVYALIGVALLPAVPTLLRVLGQRGDLSNPFAMSPAEVAGALFPPSLALVVACGAIAVLIWRPKGPRLDLNEGPIVFLLAWVAIPFVVLVFVSTLGSTTVLVPRYFASVLPAVALLAGAFVARVGAVWPQAALCIAVAAMAIVRFPLPDHTAEDWRTAAALERTLVDDADTPVLMFAGFVEARRTDWVEDPEKSSYLNAPATAYDFEGDVVALPFGVDGASEPYMQQLVREELDDVDEFVLVTRGVDTAREWLDEHLAARGFSSVERGNFGGEILVYLFARA